MSNGTRGRIAFDPAKYRIKAGADSIAEALGLGASREQKEEERYQRVKGVTKPLIDFLVDKALPLIPGIGPLAMLAKVTGASRYLTDNLFDLIGRDVFGGGADWEDIKLPGGRSGAQGKKALKKIIDQIKEGTSLPQGDRALESFVGGLQSYGLEKGYDLAGDKFKDWAPKPLQDLFDKFGWGKKPVGDVGDVDKLPIGVDFPKQFKGIDDLNSDGVIDIQDLIISKQPTVKTLPVGPGVGGIHGPPVSPSTVKTLPVGPGGGGIIGPPPGPGGGGIIGSQQKSISSGLYTPPTTFKPKSRLDIIKDLRKRGINI